MEADERLRRALARHERSTDIVALVAAVEAWIDREGMTRGGPATAFPRAETDERVERALLLGVDAVRGVRRKSGEPYAVHPIRAAWILVDLLGSEGLPPKALAYTLVHDALEEGEGERPAAVARLDRAVPGAHFGRASALLTEPEIEVDVPGIAAPVVTTAAFVLQIQRERDPALATAVLADKIDNTLDLEYLRAEAEGEGLPHAAAKRLGHARFLRAALTGLAPGPLVDLLDDVVRYQMRRFEVSAAIIQDRASRYARTMQDREGELCRAVEAWQATLALVPR